MNLDIDTQSEWEKLLNLTCGLLDESEDNRLYAFSKVLNLTNIPLVQISVEKSGLTALLKKQLMTSNDQLLHIAKQYLKTGDSNTSLVYIKELIDAQSADLQSVFQVRILASELMMTYGFEDIALSILREGLECSQNFGDCRISMALRICLALYLKGDIAAAEKEFKNLENCDSQNDYITKEYVKALTLNSRK